MCVQIKRKVTIMMNINSIPENPQQTQAANSAPAFKGDDSKLTKAIEENTETSKRLQMLL